uniref:Interferon induced protein with tetratricopeptide repeats 1B n=1 Tax=Aotus nancymaae TaxID=37293 RepID=A0A2K5FA87_AOTNA
SEESDGKLIEDSLIQLRCHFTWKLLIEAPEIPNLENKIVEEIQFLDTKYNVGIHNLLAYVKHLKGQNEEGLESLKEAKDLIQKEHANQADVRSLVTWGNFAWVYYHMGRLAEAQTYLDKVENTCKKMERTEMDCEEGWALLKCGRKNYERAKACFKKGFEVDPENSEFCTGYAIAVHHLDGFNTATERNEAFSLLNPDDVYIKVLLPLKLQDKGQEAEGEKYIEEALTSMSSQTYVFRYAAKFYRRKGSVDRALQLLKMALQATPTSALLHHQMGLCYKAQMIQIKEATNRQPRGQDRENVDRLTIMLKATFEMAYVDLAEMYAEMGHHRKAEDIFQKVLCMKIVDDHKKQEIPYRYAINHYLNKWDLIKLHKKMSYSREKLLNALEKLAKRHVHRNVRVVESFSLLGLIHKLKGEVSDALLCYDRALRLTADLNPMF